MAFYLMPPKDPEATLDYAIDWSDALIGGETIDLSTWAVSGPDSALTIVPGSTIATETETQLFLEGGTAGSAYDITNHIVTSSSPIPRVDERTFTLRIKEL